MNDWTMQCPHASIAIANDSPFTPSMHPTPLTATSSLEFSYRITHCVTLTRQTQRHFNGSHWEHRYHSYSQCVCFSLPAFVASTMLLCPCAANFVLTARYLITLFQPQGLPPPPVVAFTPQASPAETATISPSFAFQLCNPRDLPR